jgi:hypothetical protein
MASLRVARLQCREQGGHRRRIEGHKPRHEHACSLWMGREKLGDQLLGIIRCASG